MPTKFVLLACLASALYMTGVIVVVQVVHYPLFASVDRTSLGRYHGEHVRLMMHVVFAPMVCELVASGWLVAHPPVGSSGWLTGSSLAAAIVTWAVTAVFSVPLHNRLAVGFDESAHRALMRTNAIRVAAWVFPFDCAFDHDRTGLAFPVNASRVDRDRRLLRREERFNAATDCCGS